MDYAFLYDRARHLLAIGYNVAEARVDPGYYDLLASEARFGSFVAIAQGELPQENWFALGRLLTSAGGRPVLLSWSGSMFEYLMPLLVMPAYDNTLLDQTCRASVERQIAYGRQRGVPWGISECGYNSLDAGLNYQYRAFGVPGLGLKRGLAEDLVIAPYASALALMVEPEAACVNLQRLAADGLAGRFGLYEAIDYTPARVPRGQASAIVRSFMAHHQGMILLSLSHLLLGRPMQARFESDPLFRSALLLLQERVPKTAVLRLHPADSSALRATPGGPDAPLRIIGTPDTPAPEVQLLSNGRYHVMVTNAGGGSSRWKDLAVTRWREDGTRDDWGTFCYIRDVETGKYWSGAHQPTVRARGTLRGDLLRGARRVPPHRRRHRVAHRDRGLARGRHRVAAAAHHQPLGRGAHDRRHQLRRGRPGTGGRGCAASRVLQPLRADRGRGAGQRHPVHAPAALGRGAGAVDVPPHGGPRRGFARGLVRDRPHGVHRPGCDRARRRMRCS
jgi:hypothetical protein